MKRSKRIHDIVKENYVYGYVLYYLGIEFYNYSEHTLEEICKEQGLNINDVINDLEKAVNESPEKKFDINIPVEVILDYLEHMHYIFVKKKLPYLANLVKTLKPEKPFLGLIHDIQVVFPAFVEEFIHHIQEEEDTIFKYIRVLDQALENAANPSELYFSMEKETIPKLKMDHSMLDDEMAGIREISNGYQIDDAASLQLKVTMAELEMFEKDLITHARIENEILFEKALVMEKLVKKKFSDNIQLN